MTDMGTFGKVLQGTDTAVQGVGTIGIYKCIIVGSIFTCIGLILWYNAHYMEDPIRALIVSAEEATSHKATCTSGSGDNQRSYECIKWNQNVTVSIDGKEYPISILESTQKLDYKEKDEINVISDGPSRYVYYQGLKPVLLWVGRITTFLALASALFCYYLRNNPWFKRIMGVKTGVDTARYVLGR